MLCARMVPTGFVAIVLLGGHIYMPNSGVIQCSMRFSIQYRTRIYAHLLNEANDN